MRPAARGIWVLVVGSAAVLAVYGPGRVESWARPGRGVASAVSALVPPRGVRLGHGRGTVTARAGDDGREVLTVRLRGLRPGGYTLLADDPATPSPVAVAFADVRVGRSRSATLKLDSARGRSLPNGASIDAMAGLQFEVRDERGSLVLSGGMPDPRGVKAAAAPSGCRFLEDVVLAEDFNAGTVGAPPAGWDVTGTVTGTEIALDDVVRIGDSGASVLISDIDPSVAAPEMARTFPSQDRFFAVEFSLIASATPGRTVFRLGQGSAPTVFATGLGEGLGFYEDGTIGFGVGDAIQPATPGTAYRLRIDVDLDTDLFDVAIDGTPLVTDRALGFAGPALDRIVFGGTAATTGTANVDGVAVIHKSLDCAPVANAGPDQVLEATGPTTTVSLDGSLSADPEGAALTYVWTGPFVGGTATGANPTVQFAGVGSYLVTLVVNDGFFDSPPDTVVVEIRDTTPPVLTVTGLPGQLWPPNHSLIAVHPTVTAVDLVDPAPVVTLAITSNEPDDGLGDGSTSDDFVVRSASDFDLRAERSGPGSGRVYHLTWTATDFSGNSATISGDVTVPHDRGHHGQPSGNSSPPVTDEVIVPHDNGNHGHGHGNGHHGK